MTRPIDPARRPQGGGAPAELISPAAVRAVAALLGVALLVTFYSTLTDRPAAEAAVATASPVAEAREMRLQGTLSGEVRVSDPASGATIAELVSTNGGGFVSSIARVVERERTKRGLPDEAPVSIARMENGHIVVSDPLTGLRVDLTSFGSANVAAFARLLDG